MVKDLSVVDGMHRANSEMNLHSSNVLRNSFIIEEDEGDQLLSNTELQEEEECEEAGDEHSLQKVRKKKLNEHLSISRIFLFCEKIFYKFLSNWRKIIFFCVANN